MAADWIKMRIDLQTHPKVVRILSATCSDKFRVIGGMHAVWSVFDTHSENGVLQGYTPKLMDQVVGWDGLSQAMIDVGWMAFDGEQTIEMPEFYSHNGQSGKRRAEDQKRKKDARKSPQSVRNLSANDDAKNRTREEKRREDIKEPPNPLEGDAGKESKRKPRMQLKTFIEQCVSENQKPISDYRPLIDYVEATGLPIEMIQLAWDQFKRQFTHGGKDESRMQADWRRHFQNYVEKNYFRLWYAKPSEQGNEYLLTTQGLQAKALMEKRTDP